MRYFTKVALGAIALGAAMAAVMPAADAGVSLSIGIGPRPAVWYGPPGPCAHYRYNHGTPWHNCGYAYSNGPIFVGGRWYHGPFYYRYHRGQRWYWFRGDWRRDEWRGSPGGRRGKTEADQNDSGNGQ